MQNSILEFGYQQEDFSQKSTILFSTTLINPPSCATPEESLQHLAQD
jgi:hypothetical protein